MAVTKKYDEDGKYPKGDINKVAKMLNMSDEGIRIYQKKGLVFPAIKAESERKDGAKLKDYATTLLLSVCKGDFMEADGTFSVAFFEMLDEYEKKLDEAAVRTKLPDNPDLEKVEKFVGRINRYAKTGELQ